MKTYKIGDTVRIALEPRYTRKLKTIYVDPGDWEIIYLQPYKTVILETQHQVDFYNGVEMLKANAEPSRD